MKHKALKRLVAAALGPGRARHLRVSMFCIFLSLLAGSALLLFLGKSPLTAYAGILQGAGFLPKARYAASRSMLTDFMNLLNYATPMIFASLSFAVAMRCGLFNISISGIMLATGFIASVTVGYSSIDAPLAQLLVICIGMGIGSLLGVLVGCLKHKFNANEVVVSIMLNYIAGYATSFLIHTKFIDPVTRQSARASASSMLSGLDTTVGHLRMDIPYAFPLALAAVLSVAFLFSKTRLGFEFKAVGMNQKASRYAGINIGRSVVLSMALSGLLAGLAGVSYYMGNFSSIQPRVIPSLGFDAIAVALLGNNSPAGCLLASFLVMTISVGTTYMSSRLGVLREIASLLTGLLLLFSACSAVLKVLADKCYEEIERDKGDGQ